MQQKYMKVVRGGDIAKLFVWFQQCITQHYGGDGVCVSGIQRSGPVRSTPPKLPLAFSLWLTHVQKLEGVF